MTNNLQEQLKPLLLKTLSNMGSKESLGKETKTYSFLDEIYFNSNYFDSYLSLKQIIERFQNCKNKINYNYSYRLFEQLMKLVYLQIKNRNQNLTNTLNTYLEDTDVEFAASKIKELLKTTYSKYKIILITNLIELDGIDNYELGSIKLSRICDEYLKDYPDIWDERQEGSGLVQMLSGLYLGLNKKKEILDKYQNHTALEIEFEGFHFDTEQSLILENAIQKYTKLFAYLYVCKYFLDYVQKDQYTINTKKLEESFPNLLNKQTGEQHYYVRKSENYFPVNYIHIIGNRLSEEIFVLNKNTLEQLRNRCCEKAFSNIMINEDANEINRKINRSLDWFLKSVLDADTTDKIISLFISLESLMSPPGDPLTSHTNEIAQNISIMLAYDLEERVKIKNKFKKELYPLRNNIMHHGYKFDSDTQGLQYHSLLIYVVWSIRGMLYRLNEILKHGNDGTAIREYFDRLKLKG